MTEWQTSDRSARKWCSPSIETPSLVERGQHVFLMSCRLISLTPVLRDRNHRRPNDALKTEREEILTCSGTTKKYRCLSVAIELWRKRRSTLQSNSRPVGVYFRRFLPSARVRTGNLLIVLVDQFDLLARRPFGETRHWFIRLVVLLKYVITECDMLHGRWGIRHWA